MSKQIPLSQGMFAIVDDADYEYLNQWKWYAKKSNVNYYAKRRNTEKGRTKFINMHRQLLDPAPWEQIDHINGNPLDNRRENLRICTHQENNLNRSNARPERYIYEKQGRHSVVLTIGKFDTLEEAIEARDKALKALGL